LRQRRRWVIAGVLVTIEMAAVISMKFAVPAGLGWHDWRALSLSRPRESDGVTEAFVPVPLAYL
jgi:hypothetical protein